MKSRFCWCFV